MSTNESSWSSNVFMINFELMEKMLVIGQVWPEPESTAAGKRMMQLLEYFKSSYEIFFVSTSKQNEYSAPLEDLGIQQECILLNHSSFDTLLQELNPALVLFDRYITEEQFGWRVMNVCPDAYRILDTEDLHFLRLARQKKKDWRSMDVSKREVASIYRSDLSLIISKEEMDFLKTQIGVPEDLLLYLPFLVDPPSKESLEKTPGFEERSNFISIGNFRHAPNLDAVLFLKQELWPKIRRQLPDANLYIFGAYMETEIHRLQDIPEGFILKGRAESAFHVLEKARILLAPLRFGAGLKGKIFDAMCAGTPNITTGIGAEGMNPGKWNGFIEDGTEGFVNAAVQLYRNKELWNSCQNQGFQILEQMFHKQPHLERLDQRLLAGKENLLQNRLNNFTGMMLLHHSMQSTKYLSKYISAKTQWNQEEA